mgnify:CR=1 FL=1
MGAESNKYLSLKTAAQLYGYTRDHLGLMIRQGKLQGTKLGSYYVTTDGWMQEYIKKYADLNHPKNKSKISNSFLTGALSAAVKSASLADTPIKIPAADSAAKVLKAKRAHAEYGPSGEPHFPGKNSGEKDPNFLLAEAILEELARLKQAPAAADISGRQKEEMIPPREVPLMILPIRKMEKFEKHEILKRISPDYGPEETRDIA